jgi:hypothetical protein
MNLTFLSPRSVIPAASKPAATAATAAPAVPAERSMAEIARGPTPKQEAVAQQKAAFVREVWHLAASTGNPLKTCVASVAAGSDLFPALRSAGKRGTSLLAGPKAYMNFNQWIRRLGRIAGTKQPDWENWQSLLPEHRGSKKYTRPGAPEFWQLLCRLYEHPNKLSLAYAYELACRMFAEADLKSDPPTLRQVQYYYQHHADSKAVLFAREGDEYSKNSLVAYIDRAAPPVDAVWVGDHHIFDAPVRVWDQTAADWRAVRPWLTAWLDWGSLFFVGWKIRTISPNRDSIERTLKEAIQANRNSAPLTLYIDNGKDYRAALGKKRLYSERDCERLDTIGSLLGCSTVYCIPYNARAKVIERMFKEVCHRFSKLWKGYRGGCPAERPEDAHKYWTNPSTLPTLDEFTEAFREFLNFQFHAEPRSGKILSGKTAFEKRAAAAPIRAALSADQLYKAFLRELPGERAVHQGGTVKALKRLYRSEPLWDLVGTNVKVRLKIDCDDTARAFVFDAEGREIGPAQLVPRIHPMIDSRTAPPKTVEALRDELALQARQRRQLRETRRARLGLPPRAPRELPAQPRPTLSEIAEPEFLAEPTDPALVSELEALLQPACSIDETTMQTADADLLKALMGE